MHNSKEANISKAVSETEVDEAHREDQVEAHHADEAAIEAAEVEEEGSPGRKVGRK